MKLYPEIIVLQTKINYVHIKDNECKKERLVS